jgi:hypothetical protein
VTIAKPFVEEIMVHVSSSPGFSPFRHSAVRIAGFVLLVAALVITQALVVAAAGASASTIRLAPSFFIPNDVAGPGKKPVAEPGVTAFIQTPVGRVLFGADGAYLAVAVPDRGDADGEAWLTAGKSFQPWDPADRKPHSVQRMAVMRLGFDAPDHRKSAFSPRLEEPTGATMNFFVGRQEDWRTGVPTYRRLVYPGVWDGIDLEYVGFVDRLEFRLVLQPGARPGDIALATGAEVLEVTPDGGLVAELGGARLALSPPLAFQVIDGVEVDVPVVYHPLAGGRYGFTLGRYDHSQPLVIDPVLSWSTFIAGGRGANESAQSIAVDGSGSAYVLGYTPSAEFPTTTGAYDRGFNGKQDIFVAKFNADASALTWGTYLGGSGDDTPEAIIVDAAGQSYICGGTDSSDFPTTAGAFDTTYNGAGDAFVTKLNAAGSSLIYSTFLGGSAIDSAADLALYDGRVYVTGSTLSTDFPTTEGALDRTHNGQYDVFVTKLHTDGSVLSYSTYIGGSNHDGGRCIAVENGFAYVGGHTQVLGLNGNNFPTTAGAYDTTPNGFTGSNSYDGFVLKLDANGAALVYSTFLGGTGVAAENNGNDTVIDLAVQDGNAYVTGNSNSYNFPVTAGNFGTGLGATISIQLFIAKFNTTGSNLVYSGIMDTPGIERGIAIALDAGSAIVGGYHGALNPTDPPFPTTPGAYDTSYNQGGDGILVKVNPAGTALTFSTYLGGSSSDSIQGLCLQGGNIFVCGSTESADFPTSASAIRRTHYGSQDPFVTKLNGTATGLLYSSLLGCPKKEWGYDVAVENGFAYVVGSIDSLSFPLSTNMFDGDNENSIAFVTRMADDGSDATGALNSHAWSAIFGGDGKDVARAVKVGGGYVYIVGTTTSTNFPTSTGAFDTSLNGGVDAFVLKITDDGKTLTYGTYLGGANDDTARDVYVASSRAYVTGYTRSTDFPTTAGAFDTTHNGGTYDAFVTRVNSSGTGLEYSTYLGGSGGDYGYGIVASASYASVVGETGSSNFPTTATGFDTTYGGGYDAFVARLSTTGASLDYGTYLGGSGADSALSVDTDTVGYLYVTGSASDGFPVTAGALQSTYAGGGGDAFVAVIHPAFPNILTYSTYLGGATGSDVGRSLDYQDGRIYVAGTTASTDFPVTAGAWDTSYNGGTDGFVLRFDWTNPGWTYASYIGGAGTEELNAIDVEGGRAYLAGHTTSPDFPITPGAYEDTWLAQAVFVSLFKFCAADLNADGKDSALDLVLMINYLVGHYYYPGMPLPVPEITIDVNADGVNDSVDLLLLANYLAGNSVP